MSSQFDRLEVSSPKSHSPTPDDLADILDDMIGATDGDNLDLLAYEPTQSELKSANDTAPEPADICSSSASSTGFQSWPQDFGSHVTVKANGVEFQGPSAAAPLESGASDVMKYQFQSNTGGDCTKLYWDQHQRMKITYLPTLVALYQSLTRVSNSGESHNSLQMRSSFIISRLKPIIKRLNISRDDSPQVAKAVFSDTDLKNLLKLESRISLYLRVLKEAKSSGSSSPVNTSPSRVGIASPLRKLDLSLQILPSRKTSPSSPLRQQPRFFTLNTPRSPVSPHFQSRFQELPPQGSPTAAWPLSNRPWHREEQHPPATNSTLGHGPTASNSCLGKGPPQPAPSFAQYEESTGCSDIQDILRGLSSNPYEELGE
mmetsp:Transcript_13346/g.37816  ORF Transcript_13346/g.37816 Transcript_13346/m.37816 type:complete len:373 (-) Transcript_13346:368-1486(-)